MAGSKDPAGVLPTPPPPDKPYDSFLVPMDHFRTVSTLPAPQPATAVPLPELVTLPTALPQPFAAFEGPVMTPRAPSSTPRTRMPLPGHCHVPPPQPWSWPGRDPAVPAINMHLYQPVPPPPGPGATVDSFLSFVGGPPPPQPQQMTPATSVQTTSSYPPALGRIFSSPRPASLTEPAGPAPAQPESGRPSPFLLLLLPQQLPLGLQRHSLLSRPLRPPQRQ